MLTVKVKQEGCHNQHVLTHTRELQDLDFSKVMKESSKDRSYFQTAQNFIQKQPTAVFDSQASIARLQMSQTDGFKQYQQVHLTNGKKVVVPQRRDLGKNSPRNQPALKFAQTMNNFNLPESLKVQQLESKKPKVLPLIKFSQEFEIAEASPLLHNTGIGRIKVKNKKSVQLEDREHLESMKGAATP